MPEINMTSLADRLQNIPFESLTLQNGRALKEAILSEDNFIEGEVLKSLGDLHLEKGKLSKDSAEFDKAAALYAAALLRCTDPDMGQTIQHRIGFLEKLSRQLPHSYAPQYQWLSPDYWGTADSNVLRVAEICDKLDRPVGNPSVEDAYTETLVHAMATGDMFLEIEVLKSLGDFYLEKDKKSSDGTQVTKASAMYGKAITRCVDSVTKQTLNHRVLYTEKIQSLHPDLATFSQSQYSDHLKNGDSSLARADLDSAEKHFAAALKVVHVRDPTAQQYQREVEPLCKLGDVYSQRGQQTGDGGDFVKAAALYNAARARSNDKKVNSNITIAARKVGMLFLKCTLKLKNHCNISQDDTDKHKKQLKEMRDQIKLEMETIDQQLDPYVHDEDDSRVKEMETKRAQAVRQLFEKIAEQRKELISVLVEECIGLMGPPPCKYALIGLGSQATGLVTPYSDLEFAILVEEETTQNLEYFCNLTHYLHLKVVNLGETILPALGIKSLNDFYSKNPLDNWYYDSVTTRGFAFDGSMPKASKTPLGREGTIPNNSSSELICTPEEMASKLQNDVTLYLKKGYHLATILRNPCLIVGDADMVDTYMDITVKLLQADGGKMAHKLAQETLKENTKRYGVDETVTARLIDVKKDLYRFPAVAVDCLALSSAITPTTVWKTIEEMENQQVISPNNAHHLTVLTSISAELRLRTYIANGGQRENLSALASMETVLYGQEPSLQINDEVQANAPVFHTQNQKQLFRYYYTATPLKEALSKLLENKQLPLSTSNFHDKSPAVQGKMYFELCNYRMAIDCFNKAQEKAEDTDVAKMDLICKLGEAWGRIGDFKKAISYSKQALEMYRRVYGQTHHDISRVLNNMWHPLSQEGKYEEAVSCLEEALQIHRKIFGQRIPHPEIATTLSNLGRAYSDLGNDRKAIDYFEQAMKMDMRIYKLGIRTGQSLINLATVLLNLGDAWRSLGDYEKAISYLEEALQMYKSNYGQNAVHPEIATALDNLGIAWREVADYRKAISYGDQALQMRKAIYGERTPHIEISTSFTNLGTTWADSGNHTKAISYYEQALHMDRIIYGQTAANPSIATSLHNIGRVYMSFQDYKQAISYLEQALEMDKSIYGKGTAHPDIARALMNLGRARSVLGDHRRALECQEQALQMFRSAHIFGQNTPHPEIALTLSNLGCTWFFLGDHMRATNTSQEALSMARQVYRQDPNHPFMRHIESTTAFVVALSHR